MAFLEFLKIYFLGFYFVLGFAGDESSEYNKVEGGGRLQNSLQEDGARGWPTHIRDGETTKAHEKWEDAIG